MSETKFSPMQNHRQNYPSICLWLYSPCGTWPVFQFFNLYTVGSTYFFEGWSAVSQGRYVHRTTETQNKCRHPCLKWDSSPRFQCLNRLRQFMRLTARPLWWANISNIIGFNYF
jgi:hypothetical protein